MFDSFEKYIEFFKTTKKNPLPLKRGTSPIVLFSGEKALYVVVPIFAIVFLGILTGILASLKDFLGSFLYLLLLFILYFCGAMITTICCQKTYFRCKQKETTFQRLLYYNLSVIARVLKSDFLCKRYPEISPTPPGPREKRAKSIFLRTILYYSSANQRG